MFSRFDIDLKHFFYIYKPGLRSANEKNVLIYFPFSNRRFLLCFEARDPFFIKCFQSGRVLICSFWFVIVSSQSSL